MLLQPPQTSCKEGVFGAGQVVLPCLLLPLDVLECIHPFAFHVASRGGGELPVPEQDWNDGEEEAGTLVHHRAPPPRFHPRLCSQRIVPSVGEVSK